MAEYTATNIGELTAVIVGITRVYGSREKIGQQDAAMPIQFANEIMARL